MKSLFLFFCAGLYFTSFETLGFGNIQNEENFIKNITNQVNSVDAIARKASTPGYLVIKEIDFLNFKTNLKSELYLLDSVYSDFYSEFRNLSLSTDSIINLNQEAEKSEVNIEGKKIENSFFSNMPFFYVGLFAAFVLYSIFISLKFYSFYSQDITTQDQLKVVAEDFESYKRNTIERERKLKRELLDLKDKYSVES